VNIKHFERLKLGPDDFNYWRKNHPRETIDLSNGNFAEMELDEINLSEAFLQNANFSGASLIGADFSQTQISDCNFTDADARLAIFDGAVASGAIFRGANLSKAKMRMGHFDGADFTGANLSKTLFRRSSMNGAIFKKNKTPKTGIFGVNLGKAKVGPATLVGVYLPKDYRNKRDMRRIGRSVIIAINFVVLLGILFFIGQYYNKATRTYGNPILVINSYMEYSRGNMCLEKERPKEAIKHYKRAIKIKSDMAIYHYQLAHAYMESGQTYKAEESYNKYLQLKPKGGKEKELDVLKKKIRKK